MKNIRILKKIFSILPFLFSASVFSQPLLRSAADLRNTPVVTMAEGGNTSAQFILGSAFYRGDEVQQDYAEAAKWFRLAAEKGQSQSVMWCNSVTVTL